MSALVFIKRDSALEKMAAYSGRHGVTLQQSNFALPSSAPREDDMFEVLSFREEKANSITLDQASETALKHEDEVGAILKREQL